MKKFWAHLLFSIVSLSFFSFYFFIPQAAAYVETGTGTALLMHANDGDSDSSWDESTNGNHGRHGSAVGGDGNDPSWTVSTLTPGIIATNECRFATCLNYNVADYVVIPDSNSLDITGDLTVEAWIHTDDLTAGRSIVTKWSTASNAVSSYRLRINNANDLEFCVSNGTAATCATTNSNFLGNGRLIHVAGTYTASTRLVATWIDGVRRTTATAAVGFTIASTATNVLIGSVYTNNPPTTVGGGNNSFDGNIDEVRISSRVPDTTITTGPVFNPGPIINLVDHSTTVEGWVMYNGGGSTINMGGWVWEQCSGAADYVAPTTGTRTIAPGGSVRITVGAGTDTATTWFTGNGTGGTDISALGAEDCLRVYGQATTTSGTIIDGVVWGAAAGTGDDELVTAGLWRDETYVSTLTTLNKQRIQLFITGTNGNTAGGDNEEGVIDWVRHPRAGFDGEGAAPGFGDHYTATTSVPTRNIPYRYRIEVPASSNVMAVELWDADVGRNASDQGSNRDWQDGGSWDTDSVYRLINPSGTTIATFTGDDTNGWDNAFMVPAGFRIQNPTQGRWTLEVDGTNGTNGADKNTMSPRVEGYQVYTDYVFVGAASSTAGTEIDHMYPYVHSGCVFRFYDFDFDNGAAGNQGNVRIRNVYGTSEVIRTYAENNLSDGGSWTANNLTDWGSGTVSQIYYGPFELISELNGTGVGGPNFATYEFRTYAGGTQTDAGDADTDTNMINMFFPVDNDGPPEVPFLTQYIAEIPSGPNPLQVGQQSELWVRVSLVNPTTRTYTNASVTIEVPSDPQITGVTVMSVTQGSTSGTGPITWTIGSVSSPGAELVFKLLVTPSSGTSIPITGVPGGALAGTLGTYDYTGRITSTNTSGTMPLGPICGLSVPVGTVVSTYVSLTSFTAKPFADGKALVEWETATEIDNLGFNLLMAESPVGPFQQVNSQIILGQINSSLPGRYYFLLENLDPTKTYYFLLEDVELDNDTTRHGPIALSFGGALSNFSASGFDPFAYVSGGQYRWGSGGGETFAAGLTSNEGGPFVQPRTKVTKTENGLLIEINPETPTINAHVFNGKTYYKLESLGYSAHADHPGQPQLLQRSLILPVPHFAIDKFEIRSLETEVLSLPPGEGLWPQPAYKPDATGTTVVDEFIRDDLFYGLNYPFPKEIIQFDGAKFVGDRYLAQIKVYPVQLKGLENELVFAKKIVLFLPFGEAVAPEKEKQSQFQPNQTVQWGLAANPQALKLRILDAGFYSVTYQELLSAGFPVQTDPRKWELYDRGNRVPLWIEGESDGRFDSTDLLTFYAEASTDAQAEKLRSYWLVPGENAGLRMGEISVAPLQAPIVANHFIDEKKLEENHVFHSKSQEDDTYFWRYLVAPSSLNQATFNFTLNDVDFNPAGFATLRLALHGVTSAPPSPDHHVIVELNSVEIMNYTFEGEMPDVRDVVIPVSLLRNGTNALRVFLPGDLPGVSYDGLYVNWFNLSYPRVFRAANNALSFRVSLYGEHEVAGFSDADILFFDLSEGFAQRLTRAQVTPQGAEFTLRFQSPDRVFGSRLVALARSELKRVNAMDINQPSQIHQQSGSYLVVVPEGLATAVGPLISHRAQRGLIPLVASMEDIVDEFGFGNKSPGAVKEAIRHFYSQSLPAQYVLLVGDGSLDPKVYMGLGDENIVPMPLVDTSMMKTGSDAWYADFNADLLPEVMIGRLPVKTPAETSHLVQKILAYESQGFTDSSWEKTVTFVKDDVDVQTASTDVEFAATLQILRSKVPEFYVQNILGEEYQGSATATKQAIIAALENGSNFVNYVGHGSINLWASEQIFHSTDVAQLTNENLSVMIAMNCLNAHYFFPTVPSLAESMLLAEHGAIAFWSSSGLSIPTEQRVLNQGFYEAIFPKGNALAQASQVSTLGQAINAAGLSLSGGNQSADVLKTFTLLGDPALQLKIPSLSQINQNPGATDPGMTPPSRRSAPEVESTGGCQAAGNASEFFGMMLSFLMPLVFVAWFRSRKTI